MSKSGQPEPTAGPCRVLLIYPRFVPGSFWNYVDTCKIFGASYPAAPLGLVTVAALLPQTWEFRLVDRNIEELDEADLAWADLVLTGGMITQQPDCLRLISLCHAHGKPVAVGGPDATSSPQVYHAADFQVRGEAEDIIAEFVAAWERGERSGVFVAEKFQVDVTKTPLPRFDLLKFDRYLYICVQYSRGCPFTCEFCDIIELYGRRPRTKATEQMLAELDRLYALGYRGHVDFVDDNLIGNKKAIKAFLPELARWLEAHDYPFEFTTEASLNLADDDELLQLMQDSNFFGVFIGIESPDPDTLAATRKKQNTRRNIATSIHKIYDHGIFVTAGFILGFDTEKASIAGAMSELIEECAIPVSMVGLLAALPQTQLTRRLEKEGRLHDSFEVMLEAGGDQCTLGINFEPKRPMREILEDYRHVLLDVYSPEAYAARLERLATLLRRSERQREPQQDKRAGLRGIEVLRDIVTAVPEARQPFWRVLTACGKGNPSAVRYIAGLMAFYVHLGPFSRQTIATIDRRIDVLEREDATTPTLAAQIQGVMLPS